MGSEMQKKNIVPESRTYFPWEPGLETTSSNTVLHGGSSGLQHQEIKGTFLQHLSTLPDPYAKHDTRLGEKTNSPLSDSPQSVPGAFTLAVPST